jgi:hypothetical protein
MQALAQARVRSSAPDLKSQSFGSGSGNLVNHARALGGAAAALGEKMSSKGRTVSSSGPMPSAPVDLGAALTRKTAAASFRSSASAMGAWVTWVWFFCVVVLLGAHLRMQG